MQRALRRAEAVRGAACATLNARAQQRGARLRDELMDLVRMLGEADALAAQLQAEAAEDRRRVDSVVGAAGEIDGEGVEEGRGVLEEVAAGIARGMGAKVEVAGCC